MHFRIKFLLFNDFPSYYGGGSQTYLRIRDNGIKIYCNMTSQIIVSAGWGSFQSWYLNSATWLVHHAPITFIRHVYRFLTDAGTNPKLKFDTGWQCQTDSLYGASTIHATHRSYGFKSHMKVTCHVMAVKLLYIYIYIYIYMTPWWFVTEKRCNFTIYLPRVQN